MGNPFEDEDKDYRVIVNSEGQYSIWPVFREVPAGWSVTLPSAKRKECLSWIEANWKDMRPQSLIQVATQG
jgi:MbtH protein